MLGGLNAGDLLDGARVTAVDVLHYEGGATFDILPAGSTGLYWANCVQLASTLAPWPDQ
jgi:hypothetical protein